ncbi:hypothetical protein DXG01_016605 [Tephrocybe rancida]|nr:hypothetical protein DXG01_016605 [Tephrocybe rancida]
MAHIDPPGPEDNPLATQSSTSEVHSFSHYIRSTPPISHDYGPQHPSDGVFISCMQSYRLPKNLERMAIPELNLKLHADLHEHVDSYPLEHFPLLFNKNPENINMDQFLQKVKSSTNILSDDGSMHNIGKMKEPIAAAYLNEIIICTHIYLQESNVNPCPKPKRYWSVAKHAKLIGVGIWRAKPDLSLLGLHNGCEINEVDITWPDICAVGELMITPDDTPTLRATTVAKVFLMLYSQGDRLYAISITMSSAGFYIHILDHQGKLSLGPFSYEKHTVEFFTLIIALSFQDVGLASDPSKLMVMTHETKRRAKTKIPFSPQPQTFAQHGRGRPFSETLKRVKAEEAQEKKAAKEKAAKEKAAKERTAQGHKRNSSPLAHGAKAPSLTPAISRAPSVSGTQHQSSNAYRQPVPPIHPDYTMYTMDNPPPGAGLDKKTLRGMRVYKVRSPTNSMFYIIKDSWILGSCTTTEADILMGISIPQIPELVSSAIVGTTASIRKELDAAFDGERVQAPHKPKTIRHLKSKHRMHQDISSSNLMLTEENIGFDHICRSPGYNLIDAKSGDLVNALVNKNIQGGVLINYDYAGLEMTPEVASNSSSIALRQSTGSPSADVPLHPTSSSSPAPEDAVSPQDLHTRQWGPLSDGNDVAVDVEGEGSEDGGEEEANVNAIDVDDEVETGVEACEEDSAIVEILDEIHRLIMPSGQGLHTGTAPFMAILLLKHGLPHQIANDLESLYYVLIFITTHLAEPGHTRLGGLFNKNFQYAPIASWFYGQSTFQGLGCIKEWHVFFNHEWYILDYISPYFAPLKPCL